MAATPRYKIYNGGEYIAAFKFAEDAVALIEGCDIGETIRIGHAKRDIIYTKGECADSYDMAAQLIHGREDEIWRSI